MDTADRNRKHDDRQIEIGSKHGIVGGVDDMERVHKMISEAHNPQGTFALLRWRGSVQEILPKVSENRDLNVMAYEVFGAHKFPATEEVVCDCIRRSHHHSLLLRLLLALVQLRGSSIHQIWYLRHLQMGYRLRILHLLAL